jgi:hypothetical protein
VIFFGGLNAFDHPMDTVQRAFIRSGGLSVCWTLFVATETTPAARFGHCMAAWPGSFNAFMFGGCTSKEGRPHLLECVDGSLYILTYDGHGSSLEDGDAGEWSVITATGGEVSSFAPKRRRRRRRSEERGGGKGEVPASYEKKKKKKKKKRGGG